MKKLVAFLLGCCTLLPSFASCGDGSEAKQPETDRLISSFETVEEVLTLTAANNFGKKQFSNNSSYVTDGKGCMYVEVIADFDYIARENIWGLDSREEFIEPHLTFESTKFDFTQVEGLYGFAIDVYNVGGKDVPVEFTMEAGVDGAGSFFDMGTQTALKGQKTTLYFTADAETMIYQGSNDIINLIITLPFRDGDEEAHKLYFDNFRMLLGDTGTTTDYACNGQQLCSFETKDVLKRLTTSSFYSVKDYWAKSELNVDPQYVTDGNASLKITRGYTNYITTGRMGKHAVTLSNGNFFNGEAIANLPVEDLERLVIKVDVYNIASQTEAIEYFIGPRIKESICMFRITQVKPNEWTTLELSVAQVIKDTADWGGVAIDLRELFVNFAFHFSFTVNRMNSDITTYVDNLRYDFN